MQVYNTLTRKKEPLVLLKEGEVGVYVCGPTVYNFIHIGNARPLCVFDTMRRYFEFLGLKVTYVQNFTDIDDKLIKKANAENTTVPKVAERFIEEFWKDSDGLNVKRATFHPKATEHMDDILDIIKTLVDNGHAYVTENGDVYFRARSFAEYGKLSHQPLDELEAGARISVGEIKEDPMDFALWKSAKPGEPFWDSPFGQGRPGWHIECSAMSRHYLGKTFDIHCGGQDLIFPHHENEIAQSECCNGSPFARYWLHNGYINVDNRKMSKSLGNFFTVREVAEKYGYEPIRFLMISAHYRTPLSYSVEVLEQCVSALERLHNCRDNLDFMVAHAEGDSFELSSKAQLRRKQFVEAMDDDLNTADALSAVFELVRDINAAENQTADSLRQTAEVFDELCGVLGILNNRAEDAVPAEVTELAQQRAEARKAKDYAHADELRGKIEALGWVLEDTPQGPKITKA